MPIGYEYDIFLSYSRCRIIKEWVENHLYPMLHGCLEIHLLTKPKIFIDWNIEEGEHWKEKLAQTLLKSRSLVTIWSPPYFNSKWCLAELYSFIERQTVLKNENPEEEYNLLFPIIFNDGDKFPQIAKDIQAKYDLTEYTIPFPQFKESHDYIPFYKKIREMAEKLANRIENVPEWNPDWPIVMPDPEKNLNKELELF